MSTIVGDVRFAIRSLLRRPGFTIVAMLTLALGIGANAAIFSAVRGILLRPLPFRAPERLVSFNAEQFISNAELLFLRDNARYARSASPRISPGWGMALTGVGEAHATHHGARLHEPARRPRRPPHDRPQRSATEESTPGRENGRDARPFELWAERFGSDPSIVGRNIVLDGTPYNVIGVLPAGFEVLGQPAALWTPLVIDPTAWFHKGAIVVARRAPSRPA